MGENQVNEDVETNHVDEDESSRREFLKSAGATGLVTTGVGTELWWLTQDSGADVDKTYLLGGVTKGWQGYAPESISGQSNPTLQLEAGNTYRLLWKNGDGVPHNFQIRDSQGSPLEVLLPLEVQKSAVNDLFRRAQQESLTNVSVANATDTPANVSYVNESGNVTANVTMGNQTGGGQTVDVVASTELLSNQGAVQGVQFTATEEMARYICVVHPTTMVGDIEVSTGGGSAATNNSSQ